MRYLNKIVFINSAHIPYAEVMLNGNVHLIGTQGVGKSTLLRTLLFFYNADKQHLGIQVGQRPFDEFYFEHANSYIVYEVMRDEGAYSILLHRYQGRAAYRFIDAPYDKTWFITDTGDALTDWLRIRENITKGKPVDISGRIDTYEAYRDIIYGNTHDRAHRYDKYAIVESQKYQNIPRSIQNVFLNSKLDAAFVKDTIIQSLEDEDIRIDLSVYRRLVENFEREYEDISLWFKKERNGDILIRRQADAVVTAYRESVALQQQTYAILHQLNYAVNDAQEQLPILRDSLQQTRQETLSIRQKRKETENEYNNQRRLLDEKIGAKKAKLREISDKLKHYQAINIYDLLLLYEQETQLKTEKRQHEALYQSLTAQYRDIEQKYDHLLKGLDLYNKEFRNEQETILNRKRDALQQRRDVLYQEHSQRKDTLNACATADRNDIDARLEQKQNDRNRAEKRLQEILSSQPFQQEVDDLRKELQQLVIQEKEAIAQQEAKEAQIKQLQQESLLESTAQDNAFKQLQQELSRQKEQVEQELAHINDLLSRWKGSLYEWLTQNKPNWEDTIGAVVDAEKILYGSAQNPRLVEDNHSLYGVQIDLAGFQSSHRSPDDYRQMKKEAEEHLTTIKQQLQDLQEDAGRRQQKINEHLADKIRPLRDEQTRYRVIAEQSPLKQKSKQTEIDTLLRKSAETKQKEATLQQENIDKLILDIDRIKQEKQRLQVKLEKECTQLDKDFKAKEKHLFSPLQELKAKQAEERKQRDIVYHQQQELYHQQREDELKGKHADVAAIKTHEEKIAQLSALLKQIENQRETVFAYRRDKEELFDREDTFRQEKKQLETRVEDLQQKFNDRKERIDTQLRELADKEQKLRQDLKEKEEGLDQYHSLIHTEHFLTAELLTDDKKTTTHKSCKALIADIRGAFNDYHRKQEELKHSIQTFNSHFTPNNIFHFNTTPTYDTDYIGIAQNLQEFLDQDKIEQYRQRTNIQYQDILQRIATEVGHIMRYRSDIDLLIKDINRDFTEKNFAGVIKSIELKSESSDDVMMRLLNSIKTFIEENNMNIGETNLFSDANKDDVNRRMIDYLVRFMNQLKKEQMRSYISLQDSFNLQFRVRENDNSTGWVSRINTVGSDGTDILVKAMINIMLINVFKSKAARRTQKDFIIHCMMDEIGKLHPNNVQGILQFANSRNIYLINSSPITNNAFDYKYIYMLSKNTKSQTIVTRLLTNNK